MDQADKGGQTIAATRFAALTGVSRERLRTWERRYGFPAPRRAGGGPRRYGLAAVGPGVAVRRAAAEGTPLAEAIARARSSAPSGGVDAAALAALVEELPVPVGALSGPGAGGLRDANPG